MFRDVPAAPFESPRGRRSADDLVNERNRLRDVLRDRERRQRVLKDLDGRHSTGSNQQRPQDGVDFSRVTELPQAAVHAYGVEAGDRLRKEFGPQAPEKRLEGEDRLVDEILRKRTREFAWKKDLRAARMRELNEERERLLRARERVTERRQVESQRPLSPPYGETGLLALPQSLYEEWSHQRLRPSLPPGPSRAPGPEPVADIIADTRLQLPRQVERYRELRQKFDKDREAKTRPYRGEMGLDSYEPWQVKHFHVCRSIVDEEVDRFMDSVFPRVPAALTEKTSKALREDERRRLASQWEAIARTKVTQLVGEELLLEITSEQCRAAVREYHFLNRLAKNMADQLCMREAEIMATSRPFGRDETDPAYTMVTDAFYLTQRDRDKTRKRLWLHKQHVHTAVAQTEVEKEQEAEDDDLRVIQYEHLPPSARKRWIPLPSDMIWEVRQLEKHVRFREAEIRYWSNFTLSTQTMSIPKSTKGISSAILSPDDRYLAIGTVHGDLLIYDLHLAASSRSGDFRCLRVLLNVNVDDPLISVGWSRDGNQLLTVNRLGLVNMWSFSAGSVSREDASKLGVEADKTTGVFPTQLTLIHQLDTDAFDFRFSSGPFSAQADVGDQKWMPNFSVFYPCFTVFGSQYVIINGMSSHDLLLIDTEPLAREFGKAVSDQPAGNANRVKKGRAEALKKLSVPKAELTDPPDHRVGNEELEADMFRAHKHPVIHLGFVNVTGDMFSVDQQGYIFVWRYDKNCLSEYSWFRPYRKYRLSMQVTSFTPNPQAVPLVRFDEKSPELKTVDQVSRQRRKVEGELSRIGVRHPWKEEGGSGIKIFIYQSISERVTESGAMFHEVTRSTTRESSDGIGELTHYQTRLYTRHIHFADLFLGCAMNVAGTELVCMLLVPETPSFPPRIELLIVDLITMTAREPRIQIELSQVEYRAVVTQGAVYFDVGRPANATGSEYVFVNLLGSFQIFSLTTGQQVGMTVEQKKAGFGRKPQPHPFPGLQLNKQQFRIRPDLEVSIASLDSRYFALSLKKGEFSIRLTRFDDSNSEESRLETSQLFMALKDKEIFPRDLRLDGDNVFFYPDTHPVAGVREILYQLMDTAVQSKLGPFPLEKRKTHDQLNRVNGYETVNRLAPPGRVKANYDEDINPMVGDLHRR